VLEGDAHPAPFGIKLRAKSFPSSIFGGMRVVEWSKAGAFKYKTDLVKGDTFCATESDAFDMRLTVS